MWNKKSREIVHKGDNGINKEKIVDELIEVLKLGQNEAKILIYYAKVENGDRPTKKELHEGAGVSDAYDPIRRLAEKKLIITTDDEIIINWKNLADIDKLKEKEIEKKMEKEEIDRSMHGSELKTKILIHEKYKGLNRPEIARKVSEALNLRKAQKALLEYYADLDSGTFATERVFTKKTGIVDMVNPRNRLADKKIITVLDDAIVINWKTLWAIAYAYDHYPEVFEED